MIKKDKFKLEVSRNWKFPGQIRLLNYLKPSLKTLSSFKNGIVWLADEPIAIYTTADSYIEHSILTTGTYENEIGKLISFSLREGDNCLDIGCNIGLQSLRMSKCVGNNGTVISFEPLTYLRNKSEKNFRLNGASNISLLPFALSDTETTINLNIDTNQWNQGTFSLMQQSYGETNETVQVKVGDTIPLLKSLEKLSLIKIDVEGFELNVLKGLKDTINRLKPKIIFEYDSNYWKRNGQVIDECYSLLSEAGYSFFQISFLGCERLDYVEKFTDGNIFCIPE